MKNINELYLVLDNNTKLYVDTAIGTSELSKIVHKRKDKLEEQIKKYRMSTKKDKELVIKNSKGKEYSVILGYELGGK